MKDFTKESNDFGSGGQTMRQICKRELSLFLLIMIVLNLCFIANNLKAFAVSFDDINQSSVFIKQKTSYTCTLASAVMMVRRASMATGNSNWSSITEDSMTSAAWISGVGLANTFSYAGINVSYDYLPGGSDNTQFCINLLSQHPEGIVLYKTDGTNHAILLTDYTNGVFYCADPSGDSVGRINIANARIVTILNAKKYWFVSSPKVTLTNSKPNNLSISVDKTSITVGETVTFTYTISGATTKGIGIDKVFSDGSYTRDKSFAVSADSGTIDYTFKQAGKYCCIIEGSNAAGYSCSPGVYVTVSEPKPILTIYYDCFRSSPTIDTTKGYYFGDYNRICTTSSAEPHQTAWDTPNVYYQTVKLGETLGVNGLHDFATFGLTAPTGYAFAGWRSGDNGALLNETTRYTATDLTDEINSGDCDVWLSASFTPRSFTVTFDANGGLCDAAEKTVTYDSTYGALPVPTRTGYSFDGWYRFIGIKDGVQVGLLGEITSASTVSVADNHTLHALWSANQITVTFDANGGTCDTVSKTVAFDSPYGELPVPARTGYNFDGWYRSIGIMDGVQVGLLGEITSASIVGVANNHTLYAFWGANQYTVTFDSEGGTCDTVSKTVTFDSPYGELPVPVRAGYTFLGWCPPIYIPDIDGKPMFYITSTSIVKNARNHTLSAFWEANTYTVSLNPVDGECVFTAITVYADGVYGVLPVPKREGYTFIGWFLDDGTLVTEDMPVTILADHALTAHWTRLYVTPVLSTASTAVLDETRGFLYGLDFGVTEEELRTQYLSLTGDGRIEIESDGAIGTGTVVRLINEETGETAATYTIVIFGDINGDGILNSTDLNLLRSMSANLVTFDSTSAQYFAADLTHDGIVNSTDVTEIRAVNARIRTVKQTI